MKKGLLLAIGVAAGLGLVAQTAKVSGVTKADLTLSKAANTDGAASNFYAAASNQRGGSGNNSTQAAGTLFSNSRNALTLYVSQSNCLTANQALGIVLFTHRLSNYWSPDANTSNGYIQHTWTSNFGTSWDSTYFADFTNLGNQRFRYPSGAVIARGTVANSIVVATGPWTDGSNWQGHYTNYQNVAYGSSSNTVVNTHSTMGTFPASFPRVDIQSTDDSAVWVTGGLYLNDDGTTAVAQGYSGAAIMKGQWDGTQIVWDIDSLQPNVHQASDGTNDMFTQTHIAFSPNGQIGYIVFFGVDATASTSTTRTFSPIVYKTVNGGANWSLLPVFDYSTITAISDWIIPASDGNLKPWFTQSQGSDVVVDNSGQLHIVCAIESGASNDDDSLGFTWTLTGVNGTMGRHYIFDVHTNANTWDAVMIDSVMTTTSDNTTIFYDDINSIAVATDARIQISANTSRDHLFYTWVDSDPLALQGENALPDLFGKGVDLVTGLWTARKQFTTSQDFYYHFSSNIALVSGTTYKIGVTNSIDADGSHLVTHPFDHYFFNGCTFDQSEFTLAIGVEEHTATFGTVSAYPNPVSDVLNLNVNLVNADNVNITLYNTVGQSIIVENREMSAGNTVVQLNTSSLPAGVYFVNVSASGSTTTSKVIVQ